MPAQIAGDARNSLQILFGLSAAERAEKSWKLIQIHVRPVARLNARHMRQKREDSSKNL